VLKAKSTFWGGFSVFMVEVPLATGGFLPLHEDIKSNALATIKVL
jgi:hypothetical protein